MFLDNKFKLKFCLTLGWIKKTFKQPGPDGNKYINLYIVTQLEQGQSRDQCTY